MRSYLDDFDRRDWQDESPDGSVQLAVVGLGWFAREQALPGIEKSEFSETTVLVTGSLEKGQEIATEDDDIEHIISYEAFHDGEAEDAYDAVYVATPTGRHLEYVETAADLGKAVLTEKPIEKSVERAERLQDVCEEAGVPLMVGYRPRLEPDFRRARELIREGVIGEVTEVHTQFSFEVLEMGGPDQWRIDRELAGGGSLMDAGVYTATAAHFFADSEAVSVQGETVSEHDAFDEGVDERGVYTVQFENGVTASCSASFTGSYNDWIEVTGTEGTLRIEPAFWFNVDREITVEREDWDVTIGGPSVDEVTEEFDHFGYSVLTGTDPEPDGAVGIADIELLEGVYESAESGERVRLDEA